MSVLYPYWLSSTVVLANAAIIFFQTKIFRQAACRTPQAMMRQFTML